MGKRKKYYRIFWWSLPFVFIIIQFFGTNPIIKKDNPADISVTTNMPKDVSVVLKEACYDCHSFETKYLWYSHVSPVSWLINRDVNDGREEVNFSEWGNLGMKKKVKLLKKISHEVSERDMPMSIYTVMHKEARLTAANRKKLVDWADAYKKQLLEK